MTEPPSYRKVNPADAPILILDAASDTCAAAGHGRFRAASDFTSPLDYRWRRAGPDLRQPEIRGPSSTQPDTLAARGIGVDEVQPAISAANANTPVGTLRNPKQSLTMQARTELSNGEQFRNIIVATRTIGRYAWAIWLW